MNNIARIILPIPTSDLYDYSVNDGMDIKVGQIVNVPFGRHKKTGIIWDITEKSDYSKKKLKAVLEILPFAPLSENYRHFIQRFSEYNMHPLGDVIRSVLQGTQTIVGTEIFYRLKIDRPLIRLTPKRQMVIDLLKKHIICDRQTLKSEVSAPVIKGLVDQNIIEIIEKPASHTYKKPILGHHNIRFNPEQEIAIDIVKEDYREKKGFVPYLLDGVTGSGKTETFLEMAAHIFQDNKQILILMPEISLTDQSASRFETHFGVKPALWHSKTSAKQKALILRGVANGSIACVIGARSSLFLPFANLGFIIIDEEHDGSYKQEEGIRYHARDMAVMRAKIENIPILLVSATPSLESFVNAQMERYKILTLHKRYGGAELPEIHLINMQQNSPDRGCWISPKLQEAIKTTYEQKEQSLLFMNRRGYAPLMICRGCGYRIECTSCSVWMVYHKKHDRLICHQCGASAAPPVSCVSCGASDTFVPCGPGVERLFDEVSTLFPQMKTIIFSSDYQNDPDKLKDILEKIRQQKVDIIIGTQMVAKGHDFQNVTNVGVIDADIGLSGGDLRANEKSFQILEQVSGRAGRKQGKQGNIYIQTYHPDHTVMQAILNKDRDGLLNHEAEARLSLKHPPFGRFAAFIISAKDQKKLHDFCQFLAQKQPFNKDISVYGPAPASIHFLRGQYRYRFLIKTPKKISIQNYIKYWLKDIKIPNLISLRIDIDPIQFL